MDVIRFADVIIAPLVLLFYSWMSPTKSSIFRSIQRLIVGVDALITSFILLDLYLDSLLRRESTLIPFSGTSSRSAEAKKLSRHILTPSGRSGIPRSSLTSLLPGVPASCRRGSRFLSSSHRLPSHDTPGTPMGSPFLNLLPPKKQVAVSAFDFSQRLFQDPKPEVFIPATGSAGAGPVLDSVGKQRYAGFSDGSLWERLFLSPSPSVRLLQRCFPMLSRMASVFDSFLRACLVMDGADSFVLLWSSRDGHKAGTSFYFILHSPENPSSTSCSSG